MIDILKEYKFIKKSKYDLACDKVTDNIFNLMFERAGYYSIYYLGIVQYLKRLIESVGDNGSYGKQEFLEMLNSFKTMDSIPDDVNDVIELTLSEFGYQKTE